MNTRDIIHRLAAKREELYSLVGTVSAVHLGDLTCDVVPSSGEAPVFGVRLVADPLAGTSYIVPEVGSLVVVTFLNRQTGYVAMVSEIDYVQMKAGATEYKLDEFGHGISRGGDSLAAVLTDLITQLSVLTVTCTAPGSPSSPPINTAAITALQTRINSILT